LMVPPLPAASRPSNTTITRCPVCTTHSWSRHNSVCSFCNSFSYSLRFSLGLSSSDSCLDMNLSHLQGCIADDLGASLVSDTINRCQNPDSQKVSQFTGQGVTSQIPAAYSMIVRSLENLPEQATLRMALRDQASGSAYNSPTCCCAWA